MDYGSFDGEKDRKRSGIGLVEIFNIIHVIALQGEGILQTVPFNRYFRGRCQYVMRVVGRGGSWECSQHLIKPREPFR